MFLRILGKITSDSRALCSGGANCPAILEMESGDFAVIGTDITNEAREKLLVGSGCGPAERIVQIPRGTLVRARAEIPATI